MNKMTENYLITGYWGEPHVTAENDRGINAAIFGAGRFVLPVGEKFRAEYIGNNTIRIYDGKLMDNGAAAGIPAGSYVDLLIANAGQGMKRSDIIAFQYSQDASTLVESGAFVVIQGTETSGTAVDPALTQNDLLEGDAAFDQMPLYRVPVSGTTISAPVKLFAVSKSIADLSGGEDEPPALHASTHATGGSDPITPSAIGAQPQRLTFAAKAVESSAWASDSTYADFPYRAAVACSGVAADMFAEVAFAPADAVGGNLAPVCQTYAGGVYLYAKAAPTATLTIPTIIVWR